MKLQVGDLQMVQGEGISVNGTPLVSAQSSQPTHGHRRPAQRDGLRLGPLSFPRWSARVYGAIAALCVVMSVGLLVTGVLTEIPLLAMLAVNALIGAVAAALLARRAGKGTPVTRAPPSAITIERRTRLLTHLKAHGKPQTIEALQAALGWTEQALLPTLADLVQAERIDEDLDLESGHWTYALPTPRMVLDTELAANQLPNHARPVTERVEALNTKSSQ